MNEKLDKDVKAILKIYDGLNLPRNKQFKESRTSHRMGIHAITLLYCDFQDKEIPYLGKDSPKFMQFKEKLEQHFGKRLKDVLYSSQNGVVLAGIILYNHPKKQ